MTNGTEVYISVDIEASGPYPPTYSLLSVGACLVDDPKDTFYRELRPIGDLAVKEALSAVGKSLEYFRENGRPPEAVMAEFERWLARAANGARPVFVGFNAAFDWAFVNYYFHHYLHRNPFGIAPIDIKAYFMGLVGAKWEDTRSSRIPEEFKGPTAQTHNALDDAQSQAEMFKKMLVARSREK